MTRSIESKHLALLCAEKVRNCLQDDFFSPVTDDLDEFPDVIFNTGSIMIILSRLIMDGKDAEVLDTLNAMSGLPVSITKEDMQKAYDHIQKEESLSANGLFRAFFDSKKPSDTN